MKACNICKKLYFKDDLYHCKSGSFGELSIDQSLSRGMIKPNDQYTHYNCDGYIFRNDIHSYISILKKQDYNDIVMSKIYLRKGNIEKVKTMFDGKLSNYLDNDCNIEIIYKALSHIITNHGSMSAI